MCRQTCLALAQVAALNLSPEQQGNIMGMRRVVMHNLGLLLRRRQELVSSLTVRASRSFWRGSKPLRAHTCGAFARIRLCRASHTASSQRAAGPSEQFLGHHCTECSSLLIVLRRFCITDCVISPSSLLFRTLAKMLLYLTAR